MARRRGQTEEQILAALRQAEGGTTMGEVCRQVGIVEQTFYIIRRSGSMRGWASANCGNSGNCGKKTRS